jgi:hypothetical protein
MPRLGSGTTERASTLRRGFVQRRDPGWSEKLVLRSCKADEGDLCCIGMGGGVRRGAARASDLGPVGTVGDEITSLIPVEELEDKEVLEGGAG